MNINNTLTSIPFTIANALNAYFSSVAENLTSKNHFGMNSTNNNDPLTYEGGLKSSRPNNEKMNL